MTTKSEKGAGAEARKPLTRPADAELSRRHLRGDLASIWTPSKSRFQVLPLACAWRFRFTGGWVRWFPINRYECLPRQESGLGIVKELKIWVRQELHLVRRFKKPVLIC